MARVFGGDDVGLAQAADDAVRNIFQISYGRRAQIERSLLKNFSHRISFPLFLSVHIQYGPAVRAVCFVDDEGRPYF